VIIFGLNMKWNGLKVKYCELCKSLYIVCPHCDVASCTGGGCQICCAPDGIFHKFNPDAYNKIRVQWMRFCNWFCWKFGVGYYDKNYQEQKLLKRIFSEK